MGSGYVREVFLFQLLPNSGPINWSRSSAGQEPRISPSLLAMMDIYLGYWTGNRQAGIQYAGNLRQKCGSVAPWIVIVEIVKRGPVNSLFRLVLLFLV